MVKSALIKYSGLGGLSISESADINLDHLNKDAIPTFMGMFPSGTSFRCVNHYRQMMNAKKFQKYDFGLEKNMEKYGQETPPEFDLSNIKDIPIALFCGKEDLLASPGDYKVLARVL